MAVLTIFDNKANRPRPQFWAGYVSADEGTISAATAATLTEVDSTEDITYSSSTKKITLPKASVFKITVQVNQTGAGSSVDIYNSTDAAVVRNTGTAAGDKTLVAYLRTTTAAKDIQVRLDDQSANGTTAATGVVLVERLGKVQ